MKELLKRNKYDIYLFIIIVSTIYSRWGLLHPTTFLAIFFLPKLYDNTHLIQKYVKHISLFFMFWMFYAFVSFFWAPDTQNAYLDLFLLFIHFTLFLEIVVFSIKANYPIRTIIGSWAFAFFLTSIVGLWEIITNNHLETAREEAEYYTHSRTDYFKKEYAIVTFYNPNTYCLFICMAFPFILYLISLSKNKIKLIRNLALAFIGIFIMSRDSSRGGLITMAIMLAIYFFYRIKSRSNRIRFYAVIAVSIIGVLVYYFGESFFASILFRLEENELLESDAREILISSSWKMFLESNGFGKGVGSMIYVLGHTNTNPTPYLYVHNMLMETLLQYGAIIGLGLICFLIYLLFNSRKVNDTAKSIIVGAVLSFPFYSVINSENLRPHFIWVFFASIYIISKYRIKAKQSRTTHV